MRDKRFIAEHRGGLLTKQNHRKLMRWAWMCSEHAITVIGDNIDNRLIYALEIAKEWENSRVSTGVAMKASTGAHAVAREFTNKVSIAIARSIGQAVATAHMADHSLGAAIYALKALKNAEKQINEERAWHNNQLRNLLPKEIVDLVQSTMIMKTPKSWKLM